jgi:hypothetical protein
MLLVDQSYFTIKWNSTLSSSLIGESWSYTCSEYTDNEKTSHLFGIKNVATFASIKISNTVINLVSGQDWTYGIVAESDIPSTSLTKFICWSLKCPDYIHFNQNNYTFWTNSLETR